MGAKELQNKIKILTGETIPEEKLRLVWEILVLEMQSACNVDKFGEEQLKELEGIFVMMAQAGEFSSSSKEVKSIKEGDVSVEYAVGTSAGSKTDKMKKRFIAGNRRMKCAARTERR